MYDLSISEIKIYLNAKIEKENEDFKNQCFLVYREADLIGGSVARLYSNKNKYPEIDKAFPGMFKEKVDPIQQKINGIVNTFELHNIRIANRKEMNKRIDKYIKQGDITEEDRSVILSTCGLSDLENYISFLKQTRKLNERSKNNN